MKQNKPRKTKTGRIRSKAKATQRLKRQAPDQKAAGFAERINRYLSHCGLCSRREADRWIETGRVSLNGKLIKQPGITVQAKDVVCVDGKKVSPQANHTYILYNKPKGQLCSRRDARGRPLIYDHLEVAPNVQSIGRLDMDTEGLLLLTDDGALTRELTHPGAKLPREYRARVAGNLSLETLETLRRGGMDIGEGDSSDPWEITVDSETRGHTWITVIINRGRWREIRRTLEAAGHPVRRLIRTRFGLLRLEEGMPRGSWRKLNRAETKKLKQCIQRQP
jgi:23S rRNA pseudouridine2605 synthase